MKTDKDRIFYFVETENDSGTPVVRVGSPDAPFWRNSFGNVSEAADAVKRRNSKARSFREIKNGLVAVYEEAN